MKLPKRYLIIPFLIVAFAYLFYSAYKEVRDKTLNEFNIQQIILAKQASRGIESFFIHYQRELSFLSKLGYIADLNEQGKKLLADFYNNHADQIKAITVVDENGILKYTYPLNPSAIGQDISQQPHVKTVIKTHKPTVSDVFTAVQGYRSIAYHVPVMEGNIYRGSIGILIPLDDLGKGFVENIKTGDTGYGWMISESGIELFNPADKETGHQVSELYKDSPSVIDMINKALTTSEGTGEVNLQAFNNTGRSLSKTLAAFYRVPLGNTFWTILIFTPEKEVFARLTSFRNRLYILISLIITVLSTYFYLSSKASNILKEEKKRKALEKILVESEKRFRVMFELSPAGIILINEKGTIIEVNTSFCETLGYSHEEMTGKNIRMFAQDANNEIAENIEFILSGKTLIHEVRNIKKDGSQCIVALYETKIVLPDGTQGILSVSNDITEKKRSLERMHTLSLALENIGECVTITDLQNKVIFVNNAFCRIYGYKEEEIINKNISIVRPAVTKDGLFDKINSDTLNGGWTGEVINIRKNGSEFPVELTTSHIKDGKGSPIALIAIASDITERKRIQNELIKAKEKAEESDRLKSAFLANISHELRTPLNAVIGFSGLMIESGPNKDTVQYSQIILKSGQHLLSLVEDIFDITMIESGQIKVNYEKTDMVSVMKEVRDIMHGEMLQENKTGVELKLKLPLPVSPLITTDPRKVKQVLMNLLRNALKFTDNGFIEFGFSEMHEPKQNHYLFYVQDTGIGIDKTYHDAIFNIFRQVDDTHTRKAGGMGIGLSIAKRTVEILGGKIWLTSEPEKGSVFYFTIPYSMDEDESESKNKINIPAVAKDYSGKTILIAEDEKSNFDFLKILFTRMNIRVLWAKDGGEAVNLCETEPSIDLVLMDIKMPVLNGLEATEIIKKTRPDLPIIAQTAYAMISDKQEAHNAGCDGYLSKPIKIDLITELLAKYL